MICKTFDNVDEAFLGVMRDVYYNYESRSAPRGMPIREILNYHFLVTHPVTKPLPTHDEARNEKMAEYLRKEEELYKAGTNRVEDFEKASRKWREFANPDGTINSAYGYLIWVNQSVGHPNFGGGEMMTPWEWAKRKLVEDRDTRQAFLRFSLPEHQWMKNKDQVCTMHGQFHIRDDRLHLTMVMRASEVFFGIPYDMPWFISLMDRMVEELTGHYPALTKGSYTHIAHCMHMYERDAEAVQKMLGE